MGLFKKTVVTPAQTSEPVKASKMVDLRKIAKVSLAKNGLEVDGGGGLAVYLVLDHSLSMKPFYANGDVQRITEQVLALSAEIDSDGQVPVFYFGSDVELPEIVSISDCAGWVDRTHTAVRWGATNYVAAMDAVVRYHESYGGGVPALVIFQTDGSPYMGALVDAVAETKKKMIELSPKKVFFAFVGFGPKRNVQFLFELDEIPGRVRDNASAFHAENPRRTKDSDLYDGVLGEFTSEWLPQVLG